MALEHVKSESPASSGNSCEVLATHGGGGADGYLMESWSYGNTSHGTRRGMLKEILVKEGNDVAEGQVVAVLEC